MKTKTKVILIRDCMDCPLSNISGLKVVCCSAKWTEPREVGKLDEITTKGIIPEWCPLEDAENVIRTEYKESLESLIKTKEGLASADFDRENAKKAEESAMKVKENQENGEKFYTVIGLSKEDLLELFQDKPEVLKVVRKLSDAEMRQLAQDVSDAIFDAGYWYILEEVFMDRFFSINDEISTKKYLKEGAYLFVADIDDNVVKKLIDKYPNNQIKPVKSDEIFFVGNSMGGYAAILFASMLGCGKAIVFSPQTFICPIKRVKYKDWRWTKQIFNTYKATLLRIPQPIYDLKKVLLKNGSGYTVDIFVSRNNKIDLAHANRVKNFNNIYIHVYNCLLYTSPSPRDLSTSRMPSSA